MKKIFTFIMLLLVAASSYAAVAAGDIAILQMNTDGSGTTIKFITFVDIPAGDIIYFTDNAYTGSALATNEGTDSWTSPGVTCGTIVSFTESSMALSASGDQIIAYIGSAASPTFITALHSDGTGFISTGTTSSNSSYLPAGLTVGTNALEIPEVDNMVYSGIISGTIAQLKTAIFNAANWTTNNTTVYDYTSTITLSDCASGATPIISISPTSFTGLDYVFGAGPSAIDSAIISGSNLTGAVSGTAIVNFEFSLDKITWGAFPGAISGPVINVAPIKVYVRLKAALAVNTYAETLTLSSAGAADSEVTFSGEVTAVPVVCTPSLQTLPYNGIAGTAGFIHSTTNPPLPAPAEVCGTNFLLSYTTIPGTDGSDNEFGNQPTVAGLTGLSSEDFGGEASFQTYPVDVSGVTAIDINAFGNEVGGGFNAGGEYLEWWYTLDGGTQTPFLTFNSGTAGTSLAASVLNLDVTGVSQVVVGFTFNMNGGSAGFEDMDVTITEYVANPLTITVGSTSMNGFTYVEGSGPSASQGNTLEWANLMGSVSSGNLVNFFEFSVNGGTTWQGATALNVAIPPFPGTSTSAVPVLVRLVAGLTAGTYFDTVVLSSTGATTVEVYLEGEVTPAPIVLVDCGDLFFSQYTESNGGNDKCYEIYNPTSSAIDLSNYSVDVYSNGSSTGSGPYALSGSIPAFGTWVVCNSSATAPYTSVADVVGGSLNNSTFFNGDDDLALLNSTGDIIDYIGQLGVDPGTEYVGGGVSTSNQNIQRISSVRKGDNNPIDAFDPSAQWVTVGTNVATGLGAHTSECAPFIWTGLVSTDWSTAGNWSNNSVPTSADVISIPTAPAGGLFPLASVDVTVSDLTIESGASLAIAPTFGLIINNGTVTNSGTLTLQSSAAGTAWLDDFTNTATYTGDITVQTFVTTGSGLGQRYFGSAVAGSQVQGLDGTFTGYPLGQLIPTATCDPNQLDAASPYSNLFAWNENNSFPTNCVQEGWTAISAATNLTPGRAYSGWVSDGSVISVTGVPNTGNVSFSTSGTSASSAGVPTANGWHLLANPFPSPLDVNAVFTSGFVSPQTYDGGSGPYSGTFNPVLITGNDLAVMQGFVARSNSGATFTASQADRVAGNEVWLRPEFTHMLEINVIGNNMADKTYVYFDSEASDVFDAIADCEKRESDFGHPTLFTNLNGQKMSLNGYAIDNMNRSVGLGLLPGTNGSYALNFDGIASFPSTSLIFLEDKLTGDFINLREQTTYSFTANTSDLADRFEIHFTAPVTVATLDASCEGGDAEITIDFGVNTINNAAIEWDYTIEANNSNVITGAAVNGLHTIEGMEEGSYTLVLNQGAYYVAIPVVINGALRVNADFENPTVIEVGQTINLNNQSNGAINYLWTVEGQSFNAVNFSHTFNTAGTFDILLEANNDDCNASKIKTIDVVAKATGIRNAGDLAQANVYTQNATIVVDLSKLNLTSNSSVEIYNLLGQSIYTNEIGNTIVRIDTRNASAYYFVTLRNKGSQKVFKVLVK